MCIREISKRALDLFLCPAIIEGVFHPVVIDTGANCTVISAEVLEKICPEWKTRPSLLSKRQSARIADSSNIRILAIKMFTVRLGNLEKSVPFNIIEHGKDILLGTDTLREFGTSINLSQDDIEVIVGGQKVELIDDFEKDSISLRILKKVVLKPGESRCVSFLIEKADIVPGQLGVVFSGKGDEPCIIPSLNEVFEGSISALLQNEGKKKRVYKQGMVLGRLKLISDNYDIIGVDEAMNKAWEPEEIPFPFYHPTASLNRFAYYDYYAEFSKKIRSVKRDDPSDTEFILGSGEDEGMFEIQYPSEERLVQDIIREDLEERLTDELRGVVEDLLRKFPKIIAKHNYDCGHLKDYRGDPVLMHVPLKGKLPRLTKSYNLSPAQQEELDTMFDYLIFHGLAKECDSTQQFGSPVFLIKRKLPPGAPKTAHSSNRIIFDVRIYNSYIDQAVSTPSTSVHSALDKLNSKAHWSSSFDLKQAYYSLGLSKETLDSGLTNVYGQKRVIQVQRALTGLSAVPIFFQKALEKELSLDEKGNYSPLFDGSVNDVIYWYDDINLITTVAGERGKEIHIKLIGDFFQRLDRMDLRISLRKCSFLYNLDKEYMNCLGFSVGRGQIRPDPKKVKNILNLPPPSNLKNLQSFLGSLNFIRGATNLRMGHLISELSQMSSSKKEFQWSNENQRCFEAIKEILAEGDIGIFAADKTTIKIVYTDASTVAYGGLVFNLQTSTGGLLKKLTLPEDFVIPNSAAFWQNRIIEHCSKHNIELAVYNSIIGDDMYSTFMQSLYTLHNIRFPYNVFEGPEYFSKHILYQLHFQYSKLLPLFDHQKSKLTKFLSWIESDNVSDDDFSSHFEHFIHAMYIATEISVCIIFLNRNRSMLHALYDPYNKPGRQFILCYQDGLFFPALLVNDYQQGTVQYESNLNLYIKDVRDPKIILEYFYKVMEDPDAHKYVKICRIFSKVIPQNCRKYPIYCLEAKSLLLCLEDAKSLLEESPLTICLCDSRTTFFLFNAKAHDSCIKSARYSLKLNLHHGHVKVMSISGKKNVSDFLTRLDFSKKDFIVNTLTPVIVNLEKSKQYENRIYSMSEIKAITDENPDILILSDKKWKGPEINILYELQNNLSLSESEILKRIEEKSEILRVSRFNVQSSMTNLFEKYFNRERLLEAQRNEFAGIINNIVNAENEESTFNLKNDLLYFAERLVMPSSLFKLLCLKEHFITVHSGISTTLKSILNIYHVLDKQKLEETVRLASASCMACIAVRPNYKRKQIFGIFHMGKAAGTSIQLDLIENLPGGSHFLTITDVYSKFISCYLIKEKTADNVIASLLNYWTLFEVSKYVAHDNGSCFIAEKTRKFLEFHNVTITQSLPMHSTSRSLIERANLSVQQAIMYFGFNQDIHYRYLFAHAIYMLNRKEILNCGLTPYELHFRCRLPPGYLHRTYRPEILSGLTEEQINADRKVLDKERKDFEACIGFIEKQLREKRQARIDKLNEIRQNHDYQVGDYVVVLDYKRWLGKNKKLRPMYLSTPFKIVSKSRKGWGFFLVNLASQQIIYRGPTHCKKIQIDKIKKFETLIPRNVLKLLNSVSTEELENFTSMPVIVEEDLADINESMLEPYENPITEDDLLADLINDRVEKYVTWT